MVANRVRQWRGRGPRVGNGIHLVTPTTARSQAKGRCIQSATPPHTQGSTRYDMVGTTTTRLRGATGPRRWLHVPLLAALTAFWACLRWLRSPGGERAGKGAPDAEGRP